MKIFPNLYIQWLLRLNKKEDYIILEYKIVLFLLALTPLYQKLKFE